MGHHLLPLLQGNNGQLPEWLHILVAAVTTMFTTGLPLLLYMLKTRRTDRTARELEHRENRERLVKIETILEPIHVWWNSVDRWTKR
jgi:hypothetical protein